MRLLVIEDEEDLAKAIAKGLSRQGYSVDAAGNGEEGLKLADENEYDMVILDLNLPGLDGLAVLQRMRATRPGILVLILTARGSPGDRVAGLDLGADDYLVKPFHFDELCARLRALLRRDMRVREPILRWDDLALDPATHSAWRGKRRLVLTRREFAILEYLMRHPGEVVSQEEFLEHVWGEEADPFSNVVRVHINSLRQKLDDDAQHPRYIGTVIGTGYRLEPTGEARAT
ncbi:MAG: response regulator transcription factor [Bacillota bacterium]|nr:response regulator transcription factor [Bacillota bacterium]